MTSHLGARWWLVVLLAFTSACSRDPATTPDQSALKPAGKTYSAEQFFQTTTVFGSDISYDGSAVLVTSDRSGVFNVYRYPLNGAEPEALTSSVTETVFGVSWFPADNRVLYTSDQGGNELNHLFVREVDGSVLDLTPGENLKASFISWQSDHSAFYVMTNERDPKAFDVYRYATDGYSREKVFQNDTALNIGEISKDGRWLSLVQSVSNADSDLYLVDLSADLPSPVLLTQHEGNIQYTALAFTPDSKELVYSTNEHGEFTQAWAINLLTGAKRKIHAADWDVDFVYFDDTGRYQIVGVNADAQTRLLINDQSTGKRMALPDLPAGDLRDVNFSADGNVMAFYINSDTSPSNLYAWEIGSKQVRRLTDTLAEGMDEGELVSSEVVRFKSFDGLDIPGLLFKPNGASATTPVGALIFIHGGPGGQSRKGYSAVVQHLVNHGYAIFMVNNRGSSGYGKTFYHLDDKKHGEDDLQDIVFGKRYLQTLDWIDGKRIGVIGGSYGGFLTMAAMAFTDEFKVGIDIFGVTNWVRTLESIPPWWESFKKSLYDEMGDPATDGERHRRISPLFHPGGIKQPILIVQGANDPRVLQVESDEMVAAIRANGVPVEYVLFPDEGHGFRKKANRIAASDAYLGFLKTHL